MKKFVKAAYPANSAWASVGAAIIVWLILQLYTYQTSAPSVPEGIRWIIIIVSSLGCYKYLNSFGLHIKGDRIFFKRLWKKDIDPQNIAAIKIARAVVKIARTGEGFDLTDKAGNPLYSMFFLKGTLDKVDLMEDLKSDVSDYWFHMHNGKQIIESCIYDQSVIDYLLTLNPNIIVF